MCSHLFKLLILIPFWFLLVSHSEIFELFQILTKNLEKLIFLNNQIKAKKMRLSFKK